MFLSILHIIVLILIVLVVIMYNVVLPGSGNGKIQRVTATLAVVALVLSFALFIYDKVVGA